MTKTFISESILDSDVTHLKHLYSKWLGEMIDEK